MTNEQIKEIVARAEDEHEYLKDRVHDLYDENVKLKEEIERLNKVLEYLEKYFSNNQDYELAQLVRDTKQANIEWLEKVIGSDKE